MESVIDIDAILRNSQKVLMEYSKIASEMFTKAVPNETIAERLNSIKLSNFESVLVNIEPTSECTPENRKPPGDTPSGPKVVAPAALSDDQREEILQELLEDPAFSRILRDKKWVSETIADYIVRNNMYHLLSALHQSQTDTDLSLLKRVFVLSLPRSCSATPPLSGLFFSDGYVIAVVRMAALQNSLLLDRSSTILVYRLSSSLREAVGTTAVGDPDISSSSCGCAICCFTHCPSTVTYAMVTHGFLLAGMETGELVVFRLEENEQVRLVGGDVSKILINVHKGSRPVFQSKTALLSPQQLFACASPVIGLVAPMCDRDNSFPSITRPPRRKQGDTSFLVSAYLANGNIVQYTVPLSLQNTIASSAILHLQVPKIIAATSYAHYVPIVLRDTGLACRTCVAQFRPQRSNSPVQTSEDGDGYLSCSVSGYLSGIVCVDMVAPASSIPGSGSSLTSIAALDNVYKQFNAPSLLAFSSPVTSIVSLSIPSICSFGQFIVVASSLDGHLSSWLVKTPAHGLILGMRRETSRELTASSIELFDKYFVTLSSTLVNGNPIVKLHAIGADIYGFTCSGDIHLYRFVDTSLTLRSRYANIGRGSSLNFSVGSLSLSEKENSKETDCLLVETAEGKVELFLL